MAGVEQAIAWQAHIGGFFAGLLAFAAFDPIQPRRAAARMKAWTRRLPAINLDTIAGCSARNATALKAPLRVRCECGARGDTCAWRPSSCADCVNLSVFVSCCCTLRGAQRRRATQSCGNRIPTDSCLCYVMPCPVAVMPNEALAKRSRARRVLKGRNLAPNS